MNFLVYVPQEFKDETLSMVELFLNKWGISYEIASHAAQECRGAHGGKCKATISISTANYLDYDGIIITDGKGIDANKTYEYRPFLDLVVKFNNSKKFLCAINNGVKVLARANIITGRRISVNDKTASDFVRLFRGIPSAAGVEIAENIITANDNQGLETPLVKMFGRIEA